MDKINEILNEIINRTKRDILNFVKTRGLLYDYREKLALAKALKFVLYESTDECECTSNKSDTLCNVCEKREEISKLLEVGE